MYVHHMRTTQVDYLLLDRELASIRQLIATVASLASLPVPPQGSAQPPKIEVVAAAAPAVAAAAQQSGRRAPGRQGRKQQMPSAAPTGTALPATQPAQSSAMHRMASSSLAQSMVNAPFTAMGVDTFQGDDALVNAVKHEDMVDDVDDDALADGTTHVVATADAAPLTVVTRVLSNREVAAALAAPAVVQQAPAAPIIAVPMAVQCTEDIPSIWADVEPKEEPLWSPDGPLEPHVDDFM